MSSTLAARLSAMRARHFVGRERETDQFRALLEHDSAQSLQYVHGQGGVGKTSWISHCAPIAESAGCSVLRLDARAIPAEPPQILAALGLNGEQASALPAPDSARPAVLFIDTFEYWQALEAWVRDELLPKLPEHLRIVICGRRPPSVDWRLDPGWHELMTVSQLGNFNETEARHYLRGRAVPEERIGEAVQFSHGNPLALAMVADLIGSDPALKLEHRVDREATRELVERLTREVIKPEQREALQLAAVAQEIDPALLASALRQRDSSALFDWLGSLSFMLPGQQGMFPHDLVRDLLMAELQGRHPGRYEELARRVFDYEVSQMLKHVAGDWRLAAAQVLKAVYALRAAPALDGFLVINAGGEMYVDLPQPADFAAMEAAVLRHQGAPALSLFRHWRKLQPEGLVVLRGPAREVLGFVFHIELTRASDEQRARDPLVQKLWDFAQARGALPPGQAFVCGRFWMSLQDHHQSSPVATTLSSLALGHTVMHPNLGLMCMVHSVEAEYWARFAQKVHIEIPAELEWSSEEHRFRTYVADWRVEPRLQWMLSFSRRVTEFDPAAAPVTPAATERSPALSQENFFDAVYDALQHYHETHQLQGNLLLQSNMVVQRAGNEAGEGARLQALRELIRETNRRLGGISKTEKASRILHRTYIEPARSQQLAADALGMGYSTFRRQLAAARELLAAELWQMEC